MKLSNTARVPVWPQLAQVYSRRFGFFVAIVLNLADHHVFVSVNHIVLTYQVFLDDSVIQAPGPESNRRAGRGRGVSR